MASGIYTITPTSVSVPVGPPVQSAVVPAGHQWIVRTLLIFQAGTTGTEFNVRVTGGQYIYKHIPTASFASSNVDTRLRLDPGQSLTVQAFGQAAAFTMTCYDFVS